MEDVNDRDREDLELGRFFRKLLTDDTSSNYVSIQTDPGFPWLVIDLRMAPTEAEALLIAKVIHDEAHRGLDLGGILPEGR